MKFKKNWPRLLKVLNSIDYILTTVQDQICWENKRVQFFGPLLTPSPLCTYYVHSPFDGMRAYNCLSALTILLETP